MKVMIRLRLTNKPADGVADSDEENEKEQLQKLTEKFTPLLDWLKTEAGDLVRSGALTRVNRSNRHMSDYATI
jgi:hypothetical protein